MSIIELIIEKPLQKAVVLLKEIMTLGDGVKDKLKGLDTKININTTNATKNVDDITNSAGNAQQAVKGLDGQDVTLDTKGAVTGLQNVEHEAGNAQQAVNSFNGASLEGLATSVNNAAKSFDTLASKAENAYKSTSKVSQKSGKSSGGFGSSLSNAASGLGGSGMLSYLGLGTAYDATVGNAMTKEINRVTSSQRGYQIDGAGGLDEITNKSLVKMNNLIPAMNANQSALNVNMMQYADTIANVGSKVVYPHTVKVKVKVTWSCLTLCDPMD